MEVRCDNCGGSIKAWNHVLVELPEKELNFCDKFCASRYSAEQSTRGAMTENE